MDNFALWLKQVVPSIWDFITSMDVLCQSFSFSGKPEIIWSVWKVHEYHELVNVVIAQVLIKLPQAEC